MASEGRAPRPRTSRWFVLKRQQNLQEKSAPACATQFVRGPASLSTSGAETLGSRFNLVRKFHRAHFLGRL